MSPQFPHSDRSIQLLLLSAMATWGVNLSAVKALTGSFGVLTLASLRMVVAVATLTSLVVWTRRHTLAWSAREYVAIALCGLLMVYANQILFAAGLERTSATNGALIIALGPIASSGLTALVFKERLHPARVAGIALGLAGVAVVVLHRPGAELATGGVGDLLLLCSVVCFAAGGVAVQRMATRIDPVAISWGAHLFGAALLVLHTALSAEPWAMQIATSGSQEWGLVLFSGMVATGLSAVVWNRAIARIGAARTALAFYWVPVFGVAFASVALGESVSAWHLLGLCAVLAGSLLGSRR